MKIDQILMSIVLGGGPFLSVLIACAGVYGSVGMDEVLVALYSVIIYWGLLAVAVILLRFTDIKEGVKDAR